MSTTADEIIGRLQQAYGVYDEAALAVQLGRDPGTFRTWRNRDQVPLSVLVDASRATDYSVEWLRGDPGAQQSARTKTPADDRMSALLTEREADVLDRYRRLPEKLRRHVEATLLLAILAHQDRAAYSAAEEQL